MHEKKLNSLIKGKMELELKARLHVLFMHAFSSLSCVFEVLSLVGSSKVITSEMNGSKRMCKRMCKQTV